MDQSEVLGEGVVEGGEDRLGDAVGVQVDGVLWLQRVKLRRALHKNEHPLALEEVVDASVVDDVLQVGPPAEVHRTAEDALNGLGKER